MSNTMRQWLISLGLAPKAPRPRIFISYRRRDGSGYAGRIADRLAKDFGDQQCFRDVEDIETGTDFVEAIEHAVGLCDALVVVIGPDWLTTANAAGQRRLDDPRDFVRIEIAAALQRGIRVIPVLVGGAVMPAADDLPGDLGKLAYRQAVEITDTRWDYDVGRLVASLEAIGIPRADAVQPKNAPNYRRRLVLAVGGVVLIVGGAVVGAATVASAVRDAAGLGPALNPNPVLPNVTGTNPVSGTSSPPAYQANDNPSAAASAPPVDNAEAARIVGTLAVADSVAAEALRTRNATALPHFYTGPALAEHMSAIQLLVASGTHIHAAIYSRSVNGLQVNGDQAFADIMFEYELEFHTADEQCVQRVPRHNSSQLIALVRQNGRWLIAQEQNRTQMPPQLCF